VSEVKTLLKTYRVEKKCEVEGCNGEVETTTSQASETIMGLPTMYKHQCNLCGTQVTLAQAYPHLVYEVDSEA
jgi:hypothetical protein